MVRANYKPPRPAVFLTPRDAHANRLIDRLPARSRRRLLAAAEPVSLDLKAVVLRNGAPIEHVFFPTTSFISEIVPGERSQLEVSLVGSEGMLGIPVALGVGVSNLDAVVQGTGAALRMRVPDFRAELGRNPGLRDAVGRYTHVVMDQMARNALCNRFHLVEQRMARWLLMSADRAHSPSFQVTHAILANMLGVRRVGITTAARTLQRRGLIDYSRGRMLVRDRRGLQKAACGCYLADLQAYNRAFEPQGTVR